MCLRQGLVSEWLSFYFLHEIWNWIYRNQKGQPKTNKFERLNIWEALCICIKLSLKPVLSLYFLVTWSWKFLSLFFFSLEPGLEEKYMGKRWPCGGWSKTIVKNLRDLSHRKNIPVNSCSKLFLKRCVQRNLHISDFPFIVLLEGVITKYM